MFSLFSMQRYVAKNYRREAPPMDAPERYEALFCSMPLHSETLQNVPKRPAMQRTPDFARLAIYLPR